MKTIACKELKEALRDRRALLSSGFYCLMGPLVVGMVALAMTTKGEGGASDATLIGMISVFTLVSAFSGGMNIAMDVMAGERERRSLAPLLGNPVGRLDVVLGKWLAVAAFASAGVLLCLLAFEFVYAPGSAPAVAVMLATGILPLAGLAAAIELALSTVCGSTKEAHTYLSMAVFVPMILGMFAVFFRGPLPGVRAVLPILGQQLQIEQWLRHETIPMAPAAALCAATSAVTAAILIAAACWLERDDAVYGS